MEPITDTKLAAKLTPAAIKTVKKFRKARGRKIRRELEMALEDAGKAFRECVPRGIAIDPGILSSFFNGEVFESQYHCLLDGKKYDLDVLEEEFHKSGYKKSPGIPGFNPRQAIAEYFDQFAHSAGRKKSFVNIIIPPRRLDRTKGREFVNIKKF